MISYVDEAQGDELRLQALGVLVTSESYSRREKRKARRSKGTFSCSPGSWKVCAAHPNREDQKCGLKSHGKPDHQRA